VWCLCACGMTMVLHDLPLHNTMDTSDMTMAGTNKSVCVPWTLKRPHGTIATHTVGVCHWSMLVSSLLLACTMYGIKMPES
jgi:hypothetical protein